MQTLGGLTFNGITVTAPFPTAPLGDPYFKYVTMLLKGESTNGSQNSTFVDSSASNHTLTRYGDTTQGTFSPFSKPLGGWGATFTTSSNITWPSDITATGSQDFCCEAWVYITGNAGTTYGLIFAGSNIFGAGGDAGNLQFSITNAGAIGMVMSGYLATASAPDGTVTFNKWHHIVWCRTGTTCAIFVNGTRISSGTSSYAATFRYVNGLNSYRCQGIYSNVRIVVGSNPYPATSATLTVPTEPLTAIGNTKLLVCQDYRIRDSSSSPYTLTTTSVGVTAFSPFTNTTEYSAATNGGSYYFDGTGDYISVPNSADFQFGAGDWTIEGWIYPTSFASYNIIADFGYGSPNTLRSFNLYTHATTGLLRLAQSSTGSNNSDPVGGFGVSLKLNEWQHIAVVRSGATITCYYNGVASATTIAALDLYATSRNLLIGTQSDLAYYHNGYISGLRMVKGSAVYTSNFTPATLPATAITNTKLLLSGTNGGVIDSAKGTDMILKGNVQASTVQKKFGNSSIYFDGSGDYLVANSAFNDLYTFGSGDFTIEFWLYLNTTTGVQIIYDGRPTSGGGGAQPTIYTSGTTLIYYTNVGNRISAAALTASTWQHIAVCRSGTATKMFVNGSQVGTTYTDSTVYVNAAGAPRLGIELDLVSYPLNGYIDDLRVTKGYARYTANFTAPTETFPGA